MPGETPTPETDASVNADRVAEAADLAEIAAKAAAGEAVLTQPDVQLEDLSGRNLKTAETSAVEGVGAEAQEVIGRLEADPSLARTTKGNLDGRTTAVKEAREQMATVATEAETKKTEVYEASRAVGEKDYVADIALAQTMAQSEVGLRDKAVAAEANGDTMGALEHSIDAQRVSSEVQRVASSQIEVADNIAAKHGSAVGDAIREGALERGATAGTDTERAVTAERATEHAAAEALTQRTAAAIAAAEGVATSKERGYASLRVENPDDMVIVDRLVTGYGRQDVPFLETEEKAKGGGKVTELYYHSSTNPELVIVERYSKASGRLMEVITVKGEGGKTTEAETKGLLRRSETGREVVTKSVAEILDHARNTPAPSGLKDSERRGTGATADGSSISESVLRSRQVPQTEIAAYSAKQKPRRPRGNWLLNLFSPGN
jgi:hypothetical protein